MTLSRKKMIIIGVLAFAFMAAIIATVFACNSSLDNDQTQGDLSTSKYGCTVTFDMNGGKSDGYRSYKVTVEKNTYLKRPTDIPLREGFVFWGWNVTGNEDDPMFQFDGQRITQNLTIYATWREECAVTFYANYGTFEDGGDTRIVLVADGTTFAPPKVTPLDAEKELTGWTNEFGELWDFGKQTAYYGLCLSAKWEVKRDIQIALAPFKYSKIEDGYSVWGVNDKTVTALTVPNIVTSISTSTFEGCRNLVSVDIPNSVTVIGESAFKDCEKLQSVTLPSGLTSIKYRTFSGCTALQSVLVPNTVTDVDFYAFSGCTALRQVDLGNGLLRISSNAFENCTALTDIRLPDCLERIGDSSFKGCSALKSITIPAKCTGMGNRVFEECTALARAELHCSWVSNYMFNNCTALTDVVLGDEVRTIGNESFGGCTGMRHVTIGDGLTEIPASAFAYCYNLRSVEIGRGVKKINDRAFMCCRSLLSVTIPNNVQTIGAKVFNGCHKLVEVYNLSDASLDGSDVNATAVVHTDAAEESIIHTTADGFSFCTTKDERTYPYAQTLFLMDYSGDKADIVLPDSYDGESYKLYKYALAHNYKLRSVKLSAGVVGFNEQVLYGSDDVTSLTVDDGNTTYSAAGNCIISTADKKFVLGCKTSVIPSDGSVTTIGENVFCENGSIPRDTFRIPSAVTRVQYLAFTNCGLASIVDNVAYVDNWAIGIGNFDANSGEKLDLKFRAGTVGIADDAFWNRNYISSVTFNAELRYIGISAFSNCDGLTAVNFNDGLVSIESSAFYNCDVLERADIPDSVTTLGWGAFIYCYELTYAKLPANLTTANTQIFDGCRSLQTIVIPREVKVIGYTMFRGCPNTVDIYYGGTEEEWKALDIRNDNEPLIKGNKHYNYEL
ncbi:MAG: leucine-rich repeat protein [Clostridiales bacterium]|nr:leucine-rich repeat protein [Clostridiales bacterium]